MPQKVTPAKSGKTPQKFGATPAKGGKTPIAKGGGKMATPKNTPAGIKFSGSPGRTPAVAKGGAGKTPQKVVGTPGKTPKKQPVKAAEEESDEDDDEFESDEFDSEMDDEDDDDAEFDSEDDDEEEDQKPVMNANKKQPPGAVASPNKKGKTNDVAGAPSTAAGKKAAAAGKVTVPAGSKNKVEKNAKSPLQKPSLATPGKTPKKEPVAEESDEDDDDEDEDDSVDLDDEDLEDEDEDELESEEDEDEDEEDEDEEETPVKQAPKQQQPQKGQKNQPAQNETNKRTKPQDNGTPSKKVKANDGAAMFPEKKTKKQEEKKEKKEEKKVKAPLMPMKADKKLLEEIEQRKRERDRSSLFFKHLPKDTTDDVIKALSSDILNVKRVNKFAKAGWLTFANEEVCKKNYEKLKNAKIGNKEIFVDYCGSKAKSPPKQLSEYQVDGMKLYVGNLPPATAQDDLKGLFPSAKDIFLRGGSRYAFVSFESSESARQAFDKNKNASVKGTKVEVSFARIYPNKQKPAAAAATAAKPVSASLIKKQQTNGK